MFQQSNLRNEEKKVGVFFWFKTVEPISLGKSGDLFYAYKCNESQLIKLTQFFKMLQLETPEIYLYDFKGQELSKFKHTDGKEYKKSVKSPELCHRQKQQGQFQGS